MKVDFDIDDQATYFIDDVIRVIQRLAGVVEHLLNHDRPGQTIDMAVGGYILTFSYFSSFIDDLCAFLIFLILQSLQVQPNHASSAYGNMMKCRDSLTIKHSIINSTNMMKCTTTTKRSIVQVEKKKTFSHICTHPKCRLSCLYPAYI